MRRATSILVVALLSLAGCAARLPPPERWSLSHLPQADLRDMERSPALRVELMIAIKVARERCTGSEFSILNRTEIETFVMRADPERALFGSRENIEAIGSKMGFEYRRAYGEQWWEVISAEMRATRLKYERHPDIAEFCRAAEKGLGQIFFTQGRDRIVRYNETYRQLSSENAKPEVAALP